MDFFISQDSVTHYDYDGLSRQVIAERKSPMRTDVVSDGAGGFNVLNVNTGDRFISSYTYGPLGLIARTMGGPSLQRWGSRISDRLLFRAVNIKHRRVAMRIVSPAAKATGHPADDPTNNRDHYHLADAMGGNVGMLIGSSPTFRAMHKKRDCSNQPARSDLARAANHLCTRVGFG